MTLGFFSQTKEVLEQMILTHQKVTKALLVFCTLNCTSRFHRLVSSIWIKVSKSVKLADKRFVWSANVPTLGSWWYMIENCCSKQVDFTSEKWISLQHNTQELTEADFTVVYTYKSGRQEITTKTAVAAAAVFHWKNNLVAYLWHRTRLLKQTQTSVQKKQKIRK